MWLRQTSTKQASHCLYSVHLSPPILIVLVSSLAEARELTDLADRAAEVVRQLWPGPLSVVLRARENVAADLAPNGRIALRCSPHPLALELVRALGPITSTSANPSGQPAAATIKAVLDYDLAVDAVLDSGITAGGQASTLADLSGDHPVCLRPGPVDFERIVAAWEG